MSLAGAIADARKSAARIYINNFADKGRQNTIDMLLVSHVYTYCQRVYATKNITGASHGSTSCSFV